MNVASPPTKPELLARSPKLAVFALLAVCCWQMPEPASAAPDRPSDQPQYYDQYQSIPLPPASSAAAPPGSDPLPANATAAQPATPSLPSAANSGQITSLSEPVWVVPPTTAPISNVNVPDLPPDAPAARPLSQPNVPAKPVNSPNLVVTATDVNILGADAELQELIRRTIKTQPGGGTSQAQLQQDVAAILATGLFANASVSNRPNPNGWSVVFNVEPIVVRSLRLEGAQALTLDVANDLFKPQLGATVSPSRLTQAVQRINQWYSQNGYTLARVLTLQPGRDGVVTITVAEGVIGAVKIRFVDKEGKTVDAKGNPLTHRTQDGFVRQQIKLQPGQIFREDVAKEDLKRLAKLGIFENAAITFEGDARKADVVYNLVEGKSRGFNFGGGFNDDVGLFGSVSYNDANFGGLAQKFNTNVLVGTRDVQFDMRFLSPYRDTDPGTPGYGANFSRRQGLSRVFDDKIKLPNGSQARERRIGGGVNLDYPVGKDWMGSLGLNYTNISMRDRDGNIFTTDERGNPLSFSGKGIDDLYTVSFSATRDLRDNATNPGNGSVITLSTEQSIPIGRGNILSNRLQANYAQYIPVDWFKSPEAEKQLPEVLAFNVQGGTVLGDLPPYNAYVLGGVNSVRGYGNGDVASSRSYIQLSAEYRFPIYRFIGGVLFADYASDLGSSDNVLGQPGIQRGKPGSGFGTGLGLRVNSPIGIIRADFGINDQGDTRLQFGFGQRF